MNRKHLPKLTNEQIGKKGFCGWFIGNESGGKSVIFQCPNNHRAGFGLHSINADGEVNASVLCYKNDYHEFCILDDWPINWSKKAGERIINEG